MRSIQLAILVLCLSVMALRAADIKIPASKLPKAVLATFKSAYPNATIKGASKEKEDGKWSFEIESIDGTTKRDIAYSADGTVLETEETVTIAAIPGDPSAAIAKLYPKGIISRVEKSTSPTGTQFEVLVKVGKKSSEVKFDADGKLLTKESHEKHESEKSEKKEKGEDKDDDDDSPR